MKKILSILILLLANGCSLEMEQQKESTTIFSNDINLNQVFSSKMKKEVDKFIIYQDSLLIYSGSKNKIITVSFFNSDSNCNILISNANYYDGSKMDGYIIYKNYLIVMYDLNQMCGSVINRKELKTEKPTNYADENSNEAKYDSFEPRGRKFVFHSPDSLELIFQGYY